MNKRVSTDKKKLTSDRKKASSGITLPSGRPIPQANPTKPFRKGWSIL
ncbi:MAG: hypothetical protein ABWX94_00885 [Candidatus Saccharimonadales bacterium]